MKDIVYGGVSFETVPVAAKPLEQFISSYLNKLWPERPEDKQREMLTDVHGLCTTAINEQSASNVPVAAETAQNQNINGDNSGDGQEVQGDKPNRGSRGRNGANSGGDSGSQP